MSGGAPGARVSLARAFVRGAVAGLTLASGAMLIYGFGAGYFRDFAVPTPLNFVVAPVMLLGLILVLWRFVVRRL
jgi:formate/nitrite transporter FocA (FNT family)